MELKLLHFVRISREAEEFSKKPREELRSLVSTCLCSVTRLISVGSF